MRANKFLPIALLASLFACNDELTQIGTSIDTSSVEITIDSAFTLPMETVKVDSIYNNTPMQMLGNVNIPNYGTIHSEFMSQFYSAANWNLGDSLRSIDSLVMSMRYSSFVGEPLSPMQLEVFQLQEPIKTPAYSNINPVRYFGPNGVTPILIGKKSYSPNLKDLPSKVLDHDTVAYSVNSTQYIAYHPVVRVTLENELTQKFYKEYKENPSTFSDINKFAKFFPGIYVRNSFGAGNILLVDNIYVRLHYKRTAILKIEDNKTTGEKDTTYYGKKESRDILWVRNIVPNVNIVSTTNAPSLDIAKNVYIKAPASLMAKMTFPVRDIIKKYKLEATNSRVLNAVTLDLPTYEVAKNDYSLAPPTNILFIRKKDYEKFFLDGLLPDNKNYFLATYSVKNKKYSFSNLNAYISNILNRTDESQRSGMAADEEILLIPVSVMKETVSDSYYGQTEVTKEVNNYLGYPLFVQFKPEDAKIKLVYTTLLRK